MLAGRRWPSSPRSAPVTVSPSSTSIRRASTPGIPASPPSTSPDWMTWYVRGWGETCSLLPTSPGASGRTTSSSFPSTRPRRPSGPARGLRRICSTGSLRPGRSSSMPSPPRSSSRRAPFPSRRPRPWSGSSCRETTGFISTCCRTRSFSPRGRRSAIS